MVCALGAAGMTITIHGSLADDCTQWTLMREGEERTEERRSKRYQREKTTHREEKSGEGPGEKRWHQEWGIILCSYYNEVIAEYL